jgi:hypothetical protein
MADFEKLGFFYLGRPYDLSAKKLASEPLLYDSKDLTTHAVCIGMTGSGKTGLCVALLEEAAIDGVPAIAIDPKGDLGNLLLAFPDLDASSFKPWIDSSEAARNGVTADEQARTVADTWKKGLADWGQDRARVGRFRDAAEATIYTPGSRAGRPLAVLGSLAAPPAALRDDAEALGERATAAAAGLLALVGIDADPLRSREHALVSNLLSHVWAAGQDLALADLIHGVKDPPFDRVGVFALESFFPAKDRMELALALNNLLASPGFAVWTEGDPLDVGQLLYTTTGKPRLSVISIAHLSEQERMFFVSLLLNEVLAWVRTQSGSQSLRAILYMDEVFGYLPPTANPPSKRPLLTLLKQARAYGLGVVLATQNPVDLDYKALSNIGTWFLGRLQTERDKLRVLDGLEGLAAGSLDRAEIDRVLSGLGKRTFLMHDVHEDAPVVFQSRWALSYLAGPLTREQIATLNRGHAAPVTNATLSSTKPVPSTTVAVRPIVEPGIDEIFLRPANETAGDHPIVYLAQLLGRAKLHYVHAASGVDAWSTVTLLGSLEPGDAAWARAKDFATGSVESEPRQGASFGPLPDAGAHVKSYRAWSRALGTWLQRERPLEIRVAAKLKAYSRPGERDGEFLGRLATLKREDRDREVEKVKDRYASKIAALSERVRRSEQRVDREREQYESARSQAAISFGATVLGTIFGRKLGSSSTLGRATTTMRGAGRAAQQKADIGHAVDDVVTLRDQLADLEREVASELARIAAEHEAAPADLETVVIAPRKSDLAIEQIALAWVPAPIFPRPER